MDMPLRPSRVLALIVLSAALCVPATAAATPGTLDESWGGPSGAANAATPCLSTVVWCAGAIAVLPDGKVLVAGATRGWNGTTGAASRLFRLDASGAVDPTFPIVTVAIDAPDTTGYIRSIEVAADGRIFVGGGFDSVTVDGATSRRIGIFALTAAGQLTAFDASASFFTAFQPSSSVNVYALVPTPDGGVVAGGDLNTCGTYPTACYLARFDATGAFDPSFTGQTTSTSVSSIVYAIEPAPGGGYYIGGLFQFYKGAPAKFIARITASGALDNGFTGDAGGAAWPYYVTAIAVDASQRVLIGGKFTTYGGVSANKLARLHTDGTLDTTFSTTSGWGPQTPGIVWSVAVDPTGRIWAGGTFASFAARGGDPLGGGIVALNPDGTKDAAVTTALGIGASGWNAGLAETAYLGVRAIVPTVWGLYVGGTFDRFASNATQRNNVVRLASGIRQLTVARAGAGTGTVTSSPAGIDCGQTCSAIFTEGGSITLTATAAAGSTFTGWSGACAGTAATCTLTLTGNETATATFAKAPAVTTTKAPTLRSSAQRIGGSGVGVTARVNGPGAITVVGRRGRTLACSARQRAAKAGTYSLVCRLNAATRAAMRTRALRIALTVTFTPTSGDPVTRRTTVAFPAYRPVPSPVTG